MYYNRLFGFIVLTKAIVDLVDSILFCSRRMRRSRLINDADSVARETFTTRIYCIARTGARSDVKSKVRWRRRRTEHLYSGRTAAAL